MGVITSWSATLGSVLFVVWAVKSAVVYFTFDWAAAEKDFLDGPVLTPWGIGEGHAVYKFWVDNVLAPYFDPAKKQAIIRTHMMLGVVISVGLLIQFMKLIRMKAMSVHRWTGRALILVAVGASPGFFSLILNFRASKIVQYAEFPIPFMIVYFGLNGWRQVRNKEIQAHRASMIMFSGCFFYFAVQRLVMVAMTAFHTIPLIEEHFPLGPVTKLSGQEYWEFLGGVGAWIAHIIVFGVCTYNAYIAPHAPKPKAA